jgi:hypothetical protein
MYKKVTHTIVEEHFDHPMATEIKKMVDCLATGTNTVSAVNYNQAIKFRLDNRNYFSRLQAKIRNYVLNLLDPRDDVIITNMVWEDLSKTIDSLGDLIVPYYGSAAGMAFSKLLKEYLMAAGDHIKAMRAGKDTTELAAKCAKTIDDIANFLSKANPVNWPAAAVTKIFTDYKNALIAQADAVIKKDIAAQTVAENHQQDILLGNPIGEVGFSDVFSTGIVKQFPERFAL